MPDKSLPKVLLDIFADRFEFGGGALVDWSEWRGLARLQRDLVVIGLVGWQFVRLLLAEQIGEFVILGGDRGEIDFGACRGDFLVRELGLLELRHRQEEQFGSRLVAYMRKGCGPD